MPAGYDASADGERRRLARSALLHALAVVIFGLLAWSGAGMVRQGVDGLAVPSLIAGSAGSLGALVIAVTVLRRRTRLAEPVATAPTGPSDAGAQRAARLSMALAAAVAMTTGVALAPSGIDRGFVISVDAVLAAALVLFALLAGDAPRTVPGPADPGRAADRR